MCSVLCAVLLLLMLPFTAGSLNNSQCILEFPYAKSYYQEGDLIIGGVLTFETMVPQMSVTDFTDVPHGFNASCFVINYMNYQHVLAFVYAITEINRNPILLPNLTMGFHIVDSCLTERTSMVGMFDIISGKQVQIPNYYCDNLHKLVAVVEGISSKISLLLARIFGMYNIPQISYSTLDPVLSDKVQFPHFYRTVPNDNSQYEALIQLIKHFGWSWVGILVSENESGIKISQVLEKEFRQIGYCIAFLEFIPYHDALDETRRKRIVQRLSSSSANVVILYGDHEYMLTLQIILYMFPIKQKMWIICSQWDVTADFDYYFLNFEPFNGSLALRIHSNKISGFENFVLDLNPKHYPNDIFLKTLWQDIFHCDLSSANCTDNKIQDSKLPNIYRDFSHYSYSIYNAVYVIAHALQAIYANKKEENRFMEDIHTWKIHKALKNVNFINTAGAEVCFDEKGDMHSNFDILNWIEYTNQPLDGVTVGRFNQNDSSQNLIIDESLIRWNTAFNKTPQSACSKKCRPGYRKSTRQAWASCCYDCIPCPEGEISNNTDMDTCHKCPEDQWPNFNRDTCIFKVISYLSYYEPLGEFLTTASLLFFFVTCVITAFFTKHRNTLVMKANNQTLSYILLISLKMCFLCTLIFIGHPVKVTCLLRQVIFGISFTCSISSILGKTVTVIIAFNATRPGSKLKNLLGPRLSNSIVIFCSLWQILICCIWLGISPPFPYYNLEVETETILAVCNEGSLIGFYCVLGYLGSLSFVCFIVAFFSRNLPDIFNEAKFITFSMLVFCSVWISFIPAYLSTKGKYVVAVEIFAILTSSSGLLGCIFIPKCYVVLYRPDLNIKCIVMKQSTQLNK